MTLTPIKPIYHILLFTYLLYISINPVFAQGIDNTSIQGVWETDETEIIQNHIHIRGWVAETDPASNDLGISRVYAVQGNDCNGYIWNETPLHIERQDVADSFGDDRYKLSGFDFNIPNQDIPFREVTITVCVDSTLTGAGYSLGTKQFTIDKLRQHDVGGYIFSVFIALLVVFCLVHILTMRYLARIRYTRKTIFLLILSIILSIIPVLIILNTINQFATIPPLLDDTFVVIRKFISYRRDGFTGLLESAWGFHSAGHRPFVPALLSTLVAEYHNLNMLSIYSINLVIGMIIIIYATEILYALTQSRRHIILMIVFALVIFNPSIRFWIDKRFLAILMGILGLVGSLHALVALRRSWISFILMIFWAWVGAASFFSGNLTWILLFPLLYFFGYRHIKYYLLWIVMAATILIPFLMDYSPSNVSGVRIPTIPSLLDGMIIFFGMPFHFSTRFENIDILNIPLPYLIGVTTLLLIVILTTCSAIFSRKQYHYLLATLVMPAFVAALAIFAVMGRSTDTDIVSPLLASRYAIYGAVVWISLIMLKAYTVSAILKNLPKNKKRYVIGISSYLIPFIISVFFIWVSNTQLPPIKLFQYNEKKYEEGIINNPEQNGQLYLLNQYPPSIVVSDNFNLSPLLGIGSTRQATQQQFNIHNQSEITVIENPSDKPLRWSIHITDIYDVQLSVGIYNENNSDQSLNYKIIIQSLDSEEVLKVDFLETITPSKTITKTIDLSQFENQKVRIQLDAITDGIYWLEPQIIYNMRPE